MEQGCGLGVYDGKEKQQEPRITGYKAIEPELSGVHAMIFQYSIGGDGVAKGSAKPKASAPSKASSSFIQKQKREVTSSSTTTASPTPTPNEGSIPPPLRSRKICVVAFRGTTTNMLSVDFLYNMNANVLGSLKQKEHCIRDGDTGNCLDDAMLPEGALIHQGFVSAYSHVVKEVRSYLDKYCRNKLTVFTGHSQGGGLALVAAVDAVLRRRVADVAVIAFGAPRVVNLETRHWLAEQIGGKRLMFWNVAEDSDEGGEGIVLVA